MRRRPTGAVILVSEHGADDGVMGSGQSTTGTATKADAEQASS